MRTVFLSLLSPETLEVALAVSSEPIMVIITDDFGDQPLDHTIIDQHLILVNGRPIDDLADIGQDMPSYFQLDPVRSIQPIAIELEIKLDRSLASTIRHHKLVTDNIHASQRRDDKRTHAKMQHQLIRRRYNRMKRFI